MCVISFRFHSVALSFAPASPAAFAASVAAASVSRASAASASAAVALAAVACAVASAVPTSAASVANRLYMKSGMWFLKCEPTLVFSRRARTLDQVSLATWLMNGIVYHTSAYVCT